MQLLSEMFQLVLELSLTLTGLLPLNLDLVVGVSELLVQRIELLLSGPELPLHVQEPLNYNTQVCAVFPQLFQLILAGFMTSSFRVHITCLHLHKLKLVHKTVFLGTGFIAILLDFLLGAPSFLTISDGKGHNLLLEAHDNLIVVLSVDLLEIIEHGPGRLDTGVRGSESSRGHLRLSIAVHLTVAS